ncbi:hypothetical protein Hanom_Chr04g00339081 [Helianthus anomalus]
MLYSVMESHIKMDVHVAYNEIQVKRAEERRIARERRLAEEATQKDKSLIEDIQEAGGSSSQTEVGGSSNQEDIEMVEAENVQEQLDQDFMIVGESSEPVDANNVLRRVAVIQRKRKAREVLLLDWKTKQFVLGASGLLIRDPIVQERVKELMNDEINEQEDDLQNEASSSGKQHTDQVFMSNPTFIYLNVQQEGEV